MCYADFAAHSQRIEISSGLVEENGVSHEKNSEFDSKRPFVPLFEAWNWDAELKNCMEKNMDPQNLEYAGSRTIKVHFPHEGFR